jgi:hypothetical protein
MGKGRSAGGVGGAVNTKPLVLVRYGYMPITLSNDGRTWYTTIQAVSGQEYGVGRTTAQKEADKTNRIRREKGDDVARRSHAAWLSRFDKAVRDELKRSGGR